MLVIDPSPTVSLHPYGLKRLSYPHARIAALIYAPNETLHLEHADDVVLSNERGKLQVFRDCLIDGLTTFMMRVAPSNCEMLFEGLVDFKPNFVLLKILAAASHQVVMHLVEHKASLNIREARLAFTNLEYLWQQHDTQILIKGQFNSAAVRSFLLWNSKTSVKGKICGKSV